MTKTIEGSYRDVSKKPCIHADLISGALIAVVVVAWVTAWLEKAL
jgi:hypothetical protein